MHFCGANQETAVDCKLFYNQKPYLELLRLIMYLFVCLFVLLRRHYQDGIEN